MKNYNFVIQHLYENGNVSATTGCLCLYVEGKGRQARFHDHEFYEIFLTVNDITHYINGRYESLKRGTLVFIKPNDIHGIFFDKSNQSDIINLSFSGEVLKAFLGYLDINPITFENGAFPHIVLSEPETIGIINMLKNVIKHSEDTVCVRIALFKLLTFFVKNSENSTVFPKWFEELCENMKQKENFAEGTTALQRLSSKSREYISRSIKKYLNMTASQFVNDLRLSYVASMLINTNEDITYLCYDSGFYSTSWFNKLFLEKYGYTPKEFRQRGRNDE